MGKIENIRSNNCMKKNYMFIILASTILGILVGTVLRDYNDRDIQHTYKDSLIKREIRASKKSIKNLIKEKEILQEESKDLKNNLKKVEIKEEYSKLESLKENLAYTDIRGDGVVVNIDAIDDSIGNIADIIDNNKVLINIVNDLRRNGGEHISINNERINQYSQIVLAGNHINIGSVSIAPPYKIECIGQTRQLSNYIKEENGYLNGIKQNYPLNVTTKAQENIDMGKVKMPNELKYLESE